MDQVKQSAPHFCMDSWPLDELLGMDLLCFAALETFSHVGTA